MSLQRENGPIRLLRGNNALIKCIHFSIVAYSSSRVGLVDYMSDHNTSFFSLSIFMIVMVDFIRRGNKSSKRKQI